MSFGKINVKCHIYVTNGAKIYNKYYLKKIFSNHLH
jgi:hypothetical protein